jgi:hypothetical protein
LDSYYELGTILAALHRLTKNTYRNPIIYKVFLLLILITLLDKETGALTS